MLIPIKATHLDLEKNKKMPPISTSSGGEGLAAATVCDIWSGVLFENEGMTTVQLEGRDYSACEVSFVSDVTLVISLATVEAARWLTL